MEERFISWSELCPSGHHLFQLLQQEMAGGSVSLQLGQVGLHLTCLVETQRVVVPLQSFHIVLCLTRGAGVT